MELPEVVRTSVIMLGITAVIFFFVGVYILVAISRMRHENKITKTLYEQINTNSIDLTNKTAEVITASNKIESFANIIRDKSESIKESLDAMEKLRDEMVETTGKISHEWRLQTESLEKMQTNSQKNLDATLKNTGDSLNRTLENAAKKTIEELTLVRGSIDKAFSNSMLKLNNVITRAIDMTSKRAFGETVDVVASTLKDVTEIFTKESNSSLNECLSAIRKISVDHFETIEELCKDNVAISKLVSSKKQSIEEVAPNAKPLAGALSRAKESLAIINAKNGIDSVVKKNEVERALTEAEIEKIFQETGGDFIQV